MLFKLTRLFSTVNSKEMHQFDKISNWWHPAGPSHILFQYNYERVDFLQTNLKKLNKNIAEMRVVDVGCGAGFLCQSMARLGAQVVGLDPNQTSFRQATEHHSKYSQQLKNLTYHNLTLQQHQQKYPSTFDLVTSMDVIEHVDNPDIFLNSLASAAGQSGLVMVSTISQSICTWLTHIVAAEYIAGIVPVGTHHYNKFISPSTLQRMMEQAGLNVLDLRELDIDWRGRFVRKSGGGNYIMIAQKPSQTNEKP